MSKKRVLAIIIAVAVMLTFNCSAFANFSVGDLIQNNTFDGGVGLPWHVVESYPARADFEIKNGKYYVTPLKDGIEGRWDVQFRHRGLIIEQGHTYTVKFTVSSTKDCYVYPKIGDQGQPYNEYWNYNNRSWQRLQLRANQPVTVTETFTMTYPTAKTCEFSFHLAGDCITSPLPYTVSFDDIHILDSQFPGYPDIPAEPTNAIRVNQVGYFTDLAKKATLVSTSTSPVAWQLKNSSNVTVASGNSIVKGFDSASGDNVHIIDFSSYNTPGKGYKLVVASAATTPYESFSFDIGTDMYSDMKYEAIKYFYHNRSAVPIEMPYADRQDLTRRAGHATDVMPNAAGTWYANEGQANYTMDLTGGWYDAGDHGKYVVNGGISTWTMMNQYERALHKGDVTILPYADGSMNIPESGNGKPDILDESRFNVELLLKMQVPDGKKYAGMAHHKAHDERWTALAIEPADDPMDRYVQPPSTAATLNLAAVASQASRLWKTYDQTFATKCLTVAEKAWAAAVANPNIIVDPHDAAIGGGTYGDDYVLDDFYWAACELYVTTGKSVYLNYIKSSPHYLKMPSKLVGGEANGLTGCFDWGNTAGMGTISLALVPNGLTAAEVTTAQNNIKAAADDFVRIADNQGYGAPIEEAPISDTLTGYPWGSNSFIANEGIVMAYAYEFSDDVKYLNGLVQTMDYLLGRNPNLQSYITGYGENALENPHHRFWSYQADNAFPKPPAGCMSGGPNSGLQDPWVRGSGWAPGQRAPQKCFMDNIESWSTNEITINWNAPFAWISSYMDEKGGDSGTTPPPPDVLYGDLNGDEKINSVDFALLKQYLIEMITVFPSENGMKAADVSGDGKINSIDFSLMRQYLLGIIEEFPAAK